jgi:FkbM family methyltransferase
MDKIKYDKKHDIWYRKKSDDTRMIKEVMDLEIYKKLDLTKNDIVLNLGANIGTFEKKYNKLCKKIISVEPLINNIKLFNLNCRKMSNVKLICGAVLNTSNDKIPFYIKENNYSGGSLTVKKGYKKIEVDTIGLEDLLNKFLISKMKVDIEFAEFLINWNVLSNFDIKKIMIEIHNNKKYRYKIIPLINNIKNHGYYTSFNRKKITSNFPITVLFNKFD